jgi:hypothetical protein
MQARMKNPAMILPDAMQAIQALRSATEKGGVPSTTLGLIHLRASQITWLQRLRGLGHLLRPTGRRIR